MPPPRRAHQQRRSQRAHLRHVAAQFTADATLLCTLTLLFLQHVMSSLQLLATQGDCRARRTHIQSAQDLLVAHPVVAQLCHSRRAGLHLAHLLRVLPYLSATRSLWIFWWPSLSQVSVAKSDSFYACERAAARYLMQMLCARTAQVTKVHSATVIRD